MYDTPTLLVPLFKLLNVIFPIGEELKTTLISGFYSKRIKKGMILLEEGEVCKNLWFLAEGLLRSYHNIGDREITSRIMFKNHIVISPGSFFKQTPATESIEVLKEGFVLILSYDNLQNIYKAFPQFNYHTRLITEDYFFKQEQRLYMLRKEDAGSKYEYFIKHYADYNEFVPQKYIASFLNISRETFNRTRTLHEKQRKNV